MDKDGNALDLTVRGNSSSSTNTYTPVLTDAEAQQFTVENVLGGTDSWLPTEQTNVVAAPAVSIEGSTLSWTAVEDARCYVIFKNGEYYANQTGTSYSLTEEGLYTVRAANEMGGLGAAASDIVFKRSITAGNWSTIVLPFDIPSSDITTIFGAEASVAELSSSTENTLNFSTTLTDSKMKANQPYAIKVASNFSVVKLNSVTTDFAADPKQTIGDWTFQGSYAAETSIPVGSYYFNDNKLYKAITEGKKKIKGFRGYFTYSATPAPELNFVIDGETTGIENVNRETINNNRYFNLNGQRVAQPTKGLYIVNGKKVIVK